MYVKLCSGLASQRAMLTLVGVSPISFAYRLLGEAGSWAVYKTMRHSSNLLASVVNKDVPIGGERPMMETRCVSELTAARRYRGV